MYRDIHAIIEGIATDEDRRYVQHHIAYLETTISLLRDERDFLRGQNALALRSIKFDLHPELP